MDGTAETRELRDDPSGPPEIGRTFAGRYQILAVLGEGGFGTVYAARDQQLDRDVAVKVLDDDDPVALARFLLEAKIVAALDSEHIVRLHEAAIAGRTPYIVMERLRGADLATVLRDRGRLSPVDAVEYILQAILGIAHAHGRAVFHRDLKPRNLYLAERPDGTSVIKVLDFGVAKVADSQLTESGAAVGTMRYMSPEQLRSSASVDARTDIWALGVVLYELVSGKPLFDAESGAAVGVAILTARHRPVREHAPSVSSQLASVIDRCLEKVPENRYPDLVSLARALGADSERLARVEHACNPQGVRAATPAPRVADRKTRSLVIGSLVLAAGGVAFGIAMALRSTEPRVIERESLHDAATATAIDASAPVVDAAPVIVVDASVAVPVDAPARRRPVITKQPPPPKEEVPAAEIDGIANVCNYERSIAPMFLKPGISGGTYGCRQLGLLGCAGIVSACAKLAITDDEKKRCRDFILMIQRVPCAAGIK